MHCNNITITLHCNHIAITLQCNHTAITLQSHCNHIATTLHYVAITSHYTTVHHSTSQDFITCSRMRCATLGPCRSRVIASATCRTAPHRTAPHRRERERERERDGDRVARRVRGSGVACSAPLSASSRDPSLPPVRPSLLPQERVGSNHQTHLPRCSCNCHIYYGVRPLGADRWRSCNRRPSCDGRYYDSIIAPHTSTRTASPIAVTSARYWRRCGSTVGYW